MPTKLQSVGGCNCTITCVITVSGTPTTFHYPRTLNLTKDAPNTTFAVTLPATMTYNPATSFWESAWFDISAAGVGCTWMQIRAACSDFGVAVGGAGAPNNRFGTVSGVPSACAAPLSTTTVVSKTLSPLSFKVRAAPGGTGGLGPPKLTYTISQ